MKNVGMSLGRYIKSDPHNFDGIWKPSMRIRVAMHVEKPLKRRLRLKREGDNWHWINFKYESLGTFCFVYVLSGHSERDFNIVYANPDKMVEKAFGAWLRAPSRNMKNSSRSRWLRNAGDGGSSWSRQSRQGEQSSTEQAGGGETKRDSWKLEELSARLKGIMEQSKSNRETILCWKVGM